MMVCETGGIMMVKLSSSFRMKVFFSYPFFERGGEKMNETTVESEGAGGHILRDSGAGAHERARADSHGSHHHERNN